MKRKMSLVDLIGDSLLKESLSLGMAEVKITNYRIGKEIIGYLTARVWEQTVQPADWHVMYEKRKVLIRYAPAVNY